METKFISTTSIPHQITAPKLADEARLAGPAQARLVDEVADKPQVNSPIATADDAVVVDFPISETALEELVANLNEQIQATTRELRFSIDKKYGRPIVTVIDKATEKVIRQIPAEVALQVADALDDATGALVSERA